MSISIMFSRYLNLTTKLSFLASIILVIASCTESGSTDQTSQLESPQTKPNVVIVITDDQGYGDIGFNGNAIVKTPNIDKLASQSVSLSDYHVSPTCSPTRGAFLTGRFSNRTGVWHTVMGRSMLRENEITIANVLKENGYQTAMFGKWHLGDNFPYRPNDRGFDFAYYHGGGGVGQTPDSWDNSYFDGHFLRNGVAEKYDGFVTDVIFDEVIRYIDKAKNNNEPFFTYIATNAPHGPMHAPPHYASAYEQYNIGMGMEHFYGMITNIDDNVARLRTYLDHQDLADNTIFIFTTDNGTVASPKLFNAGMRGKKNSEYEGGHRVPFYLHWPAGGFSEHKTVDSLSAHIDVLPTLLDMINIDKPDSVLPDGTSLVPLLQQHYGRKTLSDSEEKHFQSRMIVTDSQRVLHPIKWRKSAVMQGKWRLVNGVELYNLNDDPGQENDVADDLPSQVNAMRAHYDNWWEDLEPTFGEPTAIYLGDRRANPVALTSHDWLSEDESKPIQVPWNQMHIRQGLSNESGKHDGYWWVNVVSSGRYSLSLRRWPEGVSERLAGSLPAGEDVPGDRAYRAWNGQAFAASTSYIEIAGLRKMSKVDAQEEITFTLDLPEGRAKLKAWFSDEQGKELGAYFVTVTKI